jgi:acetyl-CoA C-acetyltransferase
MTTSVIVAGARTPVGKLMGSLKDFSGSDLGALAIKAGLEKAGVAPSAVEYVIMGRSRFHAAEPAGQRDQESDRP